MSTATLTLVTLPGWMHPPEALDALRRALGQAFPDRRLRWVPLPWQTALRQDALAAQFAPCAGPCLVLGWSLGALAALALAAQAPPALEGLLLLGDARLPEDAAQDYPGVAPPDRPMRRKLRADPATLFRTSSLCTQPAKCPLHVEGSCARLRAGSADARPVSNNSPSRTSGRSCRRSMCRSPSAWSRRRVVPAAQARFLGQRLPRRAFGSSRPGHLVRKTSETLLPDLLREILPAGSLAP